MSVEPESEPAVRPSHRHRILRALSIFAVSVCLLVVLLLFALHSAPARRFAHPCFDWSERRDHLAGSLAVLLLEHSLERGWLRRQQGTRALHLTPPGAQALGRWIASPGTP